MSGKTFDPKLPMGFHYQIKNGEMIINFVCDCCNNDIRVSQKLKEKIETLEKGFQEVFDDLKDELDGKFHRCDDCDFLICQNCWDNRHEKCKNCPMCIKP
ncbi:MAG: hypothetical protein FK733_04730 [Asgard group archaeon]|nr:hypothetical protein [Asgard group archaeon]